MNEIEIKIYQFIHDKLGVEKSLITAKSSFYEDLGVDSLDFCELIVEIEKDFDIQIPDDEYTRFKTVGLLVKYVEQHIDKEIIVQTEVSFEELERLSA